MNGKTTNPTAKQFINKNFTIVNRVFDLLTEKGLSYQNLSDKLNIEKSELTKMLSGTHDLTLKQIVELEIVLETDIINVT